MRIAFFQFASSSLHFATSLEILKSTDLVQDEVHYCLWGSRTKYPGRMSVFLETLSGKPPSHFEKLVRLANTSALLENKMQFDETWVLAMTRLLMDEINSFSNLAQLRGLVVSEIQPGPALANEITTLTKNRDLNLSLNKKLMQVLIQSYLEVYSATTLFIEKYGIEQIHVFNGRFLHERAVWDAARSKNIDVVLFETTRSRYFQRREGFHNRTKNQMVMLQHWNSSTENRSDRLEIGAKYYSELRSRFNPFQTGYSEKMRLTKPYFVYFSSSDDEAVGFWEEWSESLGEQIACVTKLQEIFDSQDTVELIIRLHPNLVNKSDEQKTGWMSIKNTRSTKVISAEDKVSSYDLLDNSIGSITFGSTLGLESAFALKPSLLIADSGYDLLGVVDKAKNWDEVTEWIFGGYQLVESELLDRKENACIRGYFLATGGKDFQYTQLSEKSWGAWEARSFSGIKVPTSNVLMNYRKLISKFKFYKVLKLINNG